MTQSPRDIIVIGAGGHARVLIDVIRRMGLTPTGAVDVNTSLHGILLDGVPVIGNDEAVFARDPGDLILVNGQGNVPKLNASGLGRRRAIYTKFVERGYDFMSVVSPDAVIAVSAVLGAGVQILTRAIVHPGTRVGVNTIVNTAVRIDHDCTIGAHCHIAPGTVICDGVEVGDECHIGAAAVVVPGVRIGNGVVAGAGAAVTAHVAAGTTALGVPAKRHIPS